MNYAKKITSIIVASMMLLPYTAFAERTTYGSTPINQETVYITDNSDFTVFAEDEEYSEAIDPITDKEIELFEYFAKQLASHPEKVDVSEFNIEPQRFFDLLGVYISAFLQYEHPEIFYLYSISGSFADDDYHYSYEDEAFILDKVTPVYDQSDEEIDVKLDLINTERDKVVSMLNDNMSDLEKVLFVHDYLVSNYEYDMTYKSRTLYSMVNEKSGVCQGYSYLFKYIMDALEIPCINVPSDACAHMWNKVYVDGNWYNIDVTQDDLVPSMSANIKHGNFLLNDTEIAEFDSKHHNDWNREDWAGRPVIESTADSGRYYPLRAIDGAAVYANDTFWCLNLNKDICKIVFDNSIVLREDFTQISKDYKWWRLHGDKRSYYINPDKSAKYYMTFAEVNGNIYFNTPDSIFRYIPNENSQGKIEEVYKYQGKHNASETYFYGVREIDGKLYAEYTDDPTLGISELIEIPLEYEPVTPPSPPSRPVEIELTEVAEITYDDVNEQVEITVDIPQEISETLTETPKVMVAQYNDKGILIGITEMDITETGTGSVGCEEGWDKIKTFVWSQDNSPLALISQINASDFFNN